MPGPLEDGAASLGPSSPRPENAKETLSKDCSLISKCGIFARVISNNFHLQINHLINYTGPTSNSWVFNIYHMSINNGLHAGMGMYVSVYLNVFNPRF